MLLNTFGCPSGNYLHRFVDNGQQNQNDAQQRKRTGAVDYEAREEEVTHIGGPVERHRMMHYFCCGCQRQQQRRRRREIERETGNCNKDNAREQRDLINQQRTTKQKISVHHCAALGCLCGDDHTNAQHKPKTQTTTHTTHSLDNDLALPVAGLFMIRYVQSSGCVCIRTL